MSSVPHTLVTYQEFERLPDPQDGHYELHDGEVVLMPPPKPRHKLLQLRLMTSLRFPEAYGFVVSEEYPYKPARQYQFWYADVAVYPKEIAQQMAGWTDYNCYAPDVAIEVLSQSNTEARINQQRLVSMSHGTREFWVVDAARCVVTVSTLTGVRQYIPGDHIEVLGQSSVDVAALFDGIEPLRIPT